MNFFIWEFFYLERCDFLQSDALPTELLPQLIERGWDRTTDLQIAFHHPKTQKEIVGIDPTTRRLHIDCSTI